MLFREWLNLNTLRRFMVKEPLKVIITNFSPGDRKVIRPDIADPTCKEGRIIPMNGIIYIEQNDFKLEPERRYKRLAPGKEVRLKYYGVVKYVSHDKDGVMVELFEKNKTKGAAIHWVSKLDCLKLNNGQIAENNLEPGTTVQFERVGYYRVMGTNEVRHVIGLKDTYNAKK